MCNMPTEGINIKRHFRKNLGLYFTDGFRSDGSVVKGLNHVEVTPISASDFVEIIACSVVSSIFLWYVNLNAWKSSECIYIYMYISFKQSWALELASCTSRFSLYFMDIWTLLVIVQLLNLYHLWDLDAAQLVLYDITSDMLRSRGYFTV